MSQTKATLETDLLECEPAQPIVPPARFAAAARSDDDSGAVRRRALALVAAPRRLRGIGPHITDRRH